MSPEEFLALSDERDQWGRLCADRERFAFATGRALGRDEGYRKAHAEMAGRWAAMARPVARAAPSHAELEVRRWGPGGRERFGDPRPGDFPGRAAGAA